MGVDIATKQEMPVHDWVCYSLNHNNPSSEIPIILIERGPKNTTEMKKELKNYAYCIVVLEEKNILYLKTPDESHMMTLENDSEYQRISSVLKSTGIPAAKDFLDMQVAIKKVIDRIPDATGDFINKGLFSTHYLRSRIFDDARQDVDDMLAGMKEKIGDAKALLQELGWDISNSSGSYHDGTVSITLTNQDDFSIRQDKDAVAPSYTAVSTLRQSEWAILTNGKKWRLYSSKISASSTNYFEISLDPARDSITRYLIVLFGSMAFDSIDEKRDVEEFFNEGKNYSTTLEENLTERIMSPNGLFLDLVKGVLDHDMKAVYSSDELESAKQTALKIMYRVWFLAYAESRNLLPIKDEKYRPVSLQSIRTRLDFYDDTDNDSCWSALLKLFTGVRNGNKNYNLPQYDGNLFAIEPSIDSVSIKNRFIASALRGLLERDGEIIDYTNLSVRHLGNIFESLMEFSVRQAKSDIMLLEDKKGVREIKTKKESTYSYKKNDLYLISKAGSMSRKTSASFYTPDKIVTFLVMQGLTPILEEREKQLGQDLKNYTKSKNDKNRQICMDRLLDIQVLDPSMGSGHFLVEALNRLTVWATDMLKKYPEHPLLEEIESDQQTVISEQKKKGITIDANLLTHDVLLKRRIMKRCIFGVDLNPMAVDLAKLSLWLDSFAIGVPLTYMDHHIKHGDSTIGMFMDDLKDKQNTTLDDWTPGAESNKMIHDVIGSSDITVDQVRESEDKYHEHRQLLEPTIRILDALTASKIDSKILPKKGQEEFIHRFGQKSGKIDKDFAKVCGIVNELSEQHGFFHWELEMMDAFTDSRRGFDCIIGNPPWEKVKPNDDEFFTQYDLAFKSLKTKTEKRKKTNKLLKNPEIKTAWDLYEEQYRRKSAFYKTYEIQGTGDRDLWQIVLERMMNLVTSDGTISMIIPSQLLSNSGSATMRRNILEKNILSLYVFENRKKIFPIDSRYRFALLSIRNGTGQDKFPVGFYLHSLESLYNKDNEKEKFGTVSKSTIQNLSPDTYLIPETVGAEQKLAEKLLQNSRLESGIDGWELAMSRGFDRTNDSDLFSDNGKGWPVLEGKHIHQFTHEWSRPEFTTNKADGLERESGKNVFSGKHRNYHDSFRLVFRNVARSTDVRTMIASVIPPHVFHTNALRSIILTNNGKIILDTNYDKTISLLCGIFNSLTFDFIARTRVQMNLAPMIKSLPIPKSDHVNTITKLTGRLIVGDLKFEGLAESLRIPNKKLTPAQRIEVTAELDALIAHSYNLTKNEYKTVIESFKLFKKNPALYDTDEIIWNNNNLKEFYGEMAELALEYFEAITEAQT